MNAPPDHTPTAVFRVDAGVAIGGGHAMRCIGLAEYLRCLGWRCLFVGRSETPAAVSALGQWPFQPLDPADCDGAEREATAVAGAAGRCELLVIDSYRLDRRFERPCRRFAGRILVIDDLADRDHDCDLLLDTGLDRRPEHYRAHVPDSCVLLLGPTYAPLRAQFAALRVMHGSGLRDRKGRILISVGATDPNNVTGLILQGLQASGLDAHHVAIDLVLSSAAPHLGEVRRTAAQSRFEVTVHADCPRMADLMAAAVCVIGAGGTASWERCCLGLPTIMLVVADNQRANAAALSERGAVQLLGWPLSAPAIAESVSALLSNRHALDHMAAAARLVCDGRGAARVAAAVDPTFANDGTMVTLRPAVQNDIEDLLAWRRDKAAWEFARNPRPPEPIEHAEWVARKLSDPQCLLSIVEYGQKPAGMIRLDRIGCSRDERYEVSINVAPSHRRLGLGRAALLLARRLAPEAALNAYVMPANMASRALFAAAGFTASEQPDWYYAPPLSEMAANEAKQMAHLVKA